VEVGCDVEVGRRVGVDVGPDVAVGANVGVDVEVGRAAAGVESSQPTPSTRAIEITQNNPLKPLPHPHADIPPPLSHL
jgi:hypothetical protein